MNDSKLSPYESFGCLKGFKIKKYYLKKRKAPCRIWSCSISEHVECCTTINMVFVFALKYTLSSVWRSPPIVYLYFLFNAIPFARMRFLPFLISNFAIRVRRSQSENSSLFAATSSGQFAFAWVSWKSYPYSALRLSLKMTRIWPSTLKA
jgi:hypothetical protein